jgi:hypothetical protein
MYHVFHMTSNASNEANAHLSTRPGLYRRGAPRRLLLPETGAPGFALFA